MAPKDILAGAAGWPGNSGLSTAPTVDANGYTRLRRAVKLAARPRVLEKMWLMRLIEG